MTVLKGMCLCEQVKYEISGELGPIFNCHCSKCRRWHGAAFRTRASITKEQFRLVSGAQSVKGYESSDNVTKHFCNECGSPLHSTYKNKPNVIGIPLGAIEGQVHGPKAHMFVDSKAAWYEITDDLPQFQDWPGSESQVRETNA